MLRFFLSKLRESPGPLKEARLVACDLAEEVLDIAKYYVKRIRQGETEQEGYRQTVETPPESVGPPVSPAAPTQEVTPPPQERTLEIAEELASVLDIPTNKRKQEFKVLAILWDANKRNMGVLSAKELSEHGAKLGIVIRHENVRKIIRMRLENYVRTIQNRVGRISVYHYHLTPSGEQYFKDKYLK